MNATLILQLLAAMRQNQPTTVVVPEEPNESPVSVGVMPPGLLNTFDGACTYRVYEKDTCASPFPMDFGRQKRNAIRCRRWLWPNAIVPFALAFEDKSIERMLYDAMNDIEAVSCVRFESPERHPGSPVLEVKKGKPVPGERCKATIGTTRRQATLQLSSACSPGQVVHELLHVLGFGHEHTRPDRDKYIRVQCHNIMPNMTGDFRRLKPAVVTSFGEDYDYYSIMHYRLNHFSKNGENTLVPLVEGLEKARIGEMKKMSDPDIRKLNKLYHCESMYQVVHD